MIDFTDYQDFQFEEDGHRYVTASGEVVQSITQTMKKAGIYDFSMVPPAILENARRRGVNVHKWCAELDLYGFFDETWAQADELPYVMAWERFRRDTKIVIRKVETPMMRRIAGMMVAGTPDVIGIIGRNHTVVERKACRAKHPGWGVQTALQEMLETGRPRVGHMERIAVQLKPDGTYSIDAHDDSMDAAAGIATVTLANSTDRFELDDARLTLEAWASNNNLRLAA